MEQMMVNKKGAIYHKTRQYSVKEKEGLSLW